MASLRVLACLLLCFSLTSVSAFRVLHAAEDECESISGPSFRAIQAALPELERQGLDVRLYRIQVLDMVSSITVLFHDPNEPKGIRGSVSRIAPAISVELRKDDLQVLRWQFER